ncbi:esterase family protein [Nocardia sp. NBC_01377]|uniref:alpha/beta hydrolase n=1 Tax=Nocardia sp. NBC_01377 TaxID=2903595 RepID=UPI00325240A6
MGVRYGLAAVRGAVLLVAVVVGADAVCWSAAAAPQTSVAARAMATARPAPDGSRLTAAEAGPGRVVNLTVRSEAMGSEVHVAVLPAADDSMAAPSLYLLNGVDGGSETGQWRDGSNWLTKTDAEQFFAGERVNVVMPVGGGGTFFADWRAEDPVMGKQRWTTFLTGELPPIIDSAFGGNGVNAIAGLSMASSAVFRMALAAPGLYRAIGSYSGCVRTSDPLGQAMVSTIVTGKRGNPANMWGPPSDPAWAANDPYLHAERLRGTVIYVSTGTGQPGPLDTMNGPGIDSDSRKLLDQLLIGGALDAMTWSCTQQLRDRFQELGIAATFDFRENGTHSWGYWQEDLHNSWPVLRAALHE